MFNLLRLLVNLLLFISSGAIAQIPSHPSIFTSSPLNNDITTLTWARNKIFIATTDGSIYNINYQQENTFRLFARQRGSITAITASSTHLFTSSSSDNFIRIWDLNIEQYNGTDNFLFKLSEHNGPIESLFLWNDQFLFSGSQDGSIIQWDLLTRLSIRTFRAHSDTIISLFVAGDFMYSASRDKLIRMWSLGTGKSIRLFSDGMNVTSILISNALLYNTRRNGLNRWNITDGALLNVIPIDPSPAELFVVVGDYAYVPTMANNIEQWRISSRSLRRRFTGHTGTINNVIRSGEYLISSSLDRTVRVWHIPSCPPGRGYNNQLNRCELCPAGSFKAFPGYDSCDPCELSFYAYEGSFRCRPCPIDSECTTTGFTCLPGYEGKLEPFTDIFGNVTNVLRDCTPCPIGTFKSNRGNGQCPSCTHKSTYTSRTGSTRCNDCPQNSNCTVNGFTCLVGYEPLVGMAMCVPCSKGTFASTDEPGKCKPCINGTYAPFEKSLICMNCPTNALCNSFEFRCAPGYELSSNYQECNACPAGMYKPFPSSPFPTTQQLNTTTPPRNNNTNTSQITDEKDIDKCRPCPAGTYAQNPSSNECKPCPQNAVQCSSSSFSCPAMYKHSEEEGGCVLNTGVVVGASLGAVGILVLGFVLACRRRRLRSDRGVQATVARDSGLSGSRSGLFTGSFYRESDGWGSAAFSRATSDPRLGYTSATRDKTTLGRTTTMNTNNFSSSNSNLVV